VDFQIRLKRAVVWQSSTPESYNDLILISATVDTFDEVEVDFAVASACAHHQQRRACISAIWGIFRFTFGVYYIEVWYLILMLNIMKEELLKTVS